MNIHKAIRAVRVHGGLGQKELGQKIGNDASQIRLLENESRTPGLRTLERICKALDVSILGLIYLSLDTGELRQLDDKVVDVMDSHYAEILEEK